MTAPLPSTHDRATWLAMAHRYFEATITPEEEKALRHFLVSPQGADACFDEVRAVMGLLAVGKAVHRTSQELALRKTPHVSFWKRTRQWGIAATVIVLLGGGLQWWEKQTTSCVMYAHGQKITNEEEVMIEVTTVLNDMFAAEKQPAVEHQLTEIFNP